MKNLNTIKKEIKKQLGLTNFKVKERKQLTALMESIKITIDKPKSVKIGLVFLTIDWDKNKENGIFLEIDWI